MSQDDTDWILNRAEGAAMLGLAAKSVRLLETLPEAVQSQARWRTIRIMAAHKQEDWPTVEALAHQLIEQDADDVQWPISAAFAARRHRGLAAAETILRDARARFPKEALVVYNLACYACVDGRTEEAWDLLLQAVRLEPAYRELAESDADLIPLLPRLSELDAGT